MYPNCRDRGPWEQFGAHLRFAGGGCEKHDLAGGSRVVYEKPFGPSPENFRELDDAVQIDILEALDIDDRAEFSDETGTFLDLFVTPLLPVAVEIAMDPPRSMNADDLQVARQSVIAADRSRGLPFLLRTGNLFTEGAQQASIIVRMPPDDVPLSHDTPMVGNVLTMTLAGSGAIDLRVVVKEPGAQLTLATGTTALELAELSDADPLPPDGWLLRQ